MITRIRLLLLVSMLLVAVSACSKKTNPSRVSGKVTYKGTPVTGGSIYFHELKEDGTTGGNFRYIIKPDATYEGTEMPEGEMVVCIETESINPKAGEEANAQMKQSQFGKDQGGAFADPQKMMGMMKKGTQLPEYGQVYGTYVPIPEKYGNPKTSGLKRTLKSGKNTFDFDLTD